MNDMTVSELIKMGRDWLEHAPEAPKNSRPIFGIHWARRIRVPQLHVSNVWTRMQHKRTSNRASVCADNPKNFLLFVGQEV